MRKTMAAAIALGVAVFGAWPAQAGTTGTSAYSKICHEISLNPTPEGVLIVVIGLVSEGYSDQAIGEAVAGAVVTTCPEYLPVVEAAINKYGG